MKNSNFDNTWKLGLLVYGIILLLDLAFWVGVVYVILHFIAKVW